MSADEVVCAPLVEISRWNEVVLHDSEYCKIVVIDNQVIRLLQKVAIACADGSDTYAKNRITSSGSCTLLLKELRHINGIDSFHTARFNLAGSCFDGNSVYLVEKDESAYALLLSSIIQLKLAQSNYNLYSKS